MKAKLQTIILCFAIFLIEVVNAQVMMRRTAGESDGMFHMPELQAIISSNNDTVRIDMVLPKHIRGADYKEIEIEEGDMILMVNAKRVKHVDTFKEMYENLKIGEPIKMGVKRKGELFLINIKKADPETLPKAMIKLSTGDDDMAEHIYPLMGTGLVLNEADGKVIVEEKFEGRGSLSDKDISKGDVIIAVNGKQVKTTNQVRKVYENLEENSKVELAYARKGEEKQLSFNKPKAQGRKMIRN